MVHLAAVDRADARALAAAVDDVVRHDPVLSARVSGTDLVPATADLSTEIVDVSDEVEAHARAMSIAARPIDIDERLILTEVLRHPDGRVGVIVAIHHIATDATSHQLVLERVRRRVLGLPADSAPSYHEVVEALCRSGRARARSESHWSEHVPATRLEWARRRAPGRRSGSSTRHEGLLDDLMAAAVRRSFEGHLRALTDELAWSGLLGAALAATAWHQTGMSEVEFGLPVHHRRTADSTRVVGPLLEVFPVTVTIDPSMTFGELATAAGASVMRTLRFAQPGTSPGSPSGLLVNVLPRPSVVDDQVRSRRVAGPTIDPDHVIELQLSQYDGAVELAVEINDADAGPSSQRRTLARLRTALRSLVTDPEQRLEEWAALDSAEREVVERWGDGGDAMTGPGLSAWLVDRLDHDEVVLVDGDRRWTGRQLLEAAGRFAERLRTDTADGARVGLELGRSGEAVIAIAGSVLAGRSYVPLDPTQPRDRRDRLAGRAGVVARFDEHGVARAADAGEDASASTPTVTADPDDDADEAYLLFTSGSTGEPKGVPISRRGLAAYLRIAVARYVAPGARPVVPLFTNLTFDLTVTSLFVPLLTRGRVVVVRTDGADAVAEVARMADVTWLKATPSHAELLVRRLGSDHAVRTMILGGEHLSSDLVARLHAVIPELRVVNEYGPTEAVVGCMIHEAARTEVGSLGADVPIGHPMPGVRLRLADTDGQMVTPGRVGELWISSDGLTAGYLGGNGDAAFVTHDGRRWYRSGDLVRLDDGGPAVYLGRIDRQLKVGGIRLDPAEVEAVLGNEPGVARAVVDLTGNDGARRLTAWVERADGSTIDPEHLRAAAARWLPSHAVPRSVVVLDALPLTSNGKVDVGALPAPSDEVAITPSADGDADGDLVGRVRSTWATVLGHLPGPDDDVVAAGADSLALLEFCLALGAALDVDVPESLPRLHPTSRALAAAIEFDAPRSRAEPTRVESHGAPELTDGERALLFEHDGGGTDARYHVGRHFVLPAGVSLDRQRFESALHAVVARHEPLIWTYGTPRRRLEPSDAVEVTWLVSADPTAFDRAHTTPFDLAAGPSVRVVIAPGSDRVELLFVVHHLRADAPSFGVIWRDLMAAYEGDAPTPLGPGVADLGRWHAEHRPDPADWPTEIAEAPATLTSAAQSPDGLVRRPGALTAAELDAVGRGGLAAVLGALAIVLRRRSDGDRIEMDLITSSRTHPAADALAGYFLTTLPLELEVGPEATMHSLSNDADAALAAVVDFREVPRSLLNAERRRRGRPAGQTQVLVAYDRIEELRIEGELVEHGPRFNGTAVGDLTLFVERRGDGVDLLLEHRGTRFDEASAEVVLDEVIDLLRDTDRVHAARSERPGRTPAVLEGANLIETAPLTSRLADLIGSDGPSVAVVDGDRVGGDGFWARVAGLAAALRTAGVDHGARVLVVQGRTPDAVASMLACWCVGAGYVPVDPDYPPGRIERIVATAGAEVALVDAATAGLALVATSIRVDEVASEADLEPINQALRAVSPDAEAYVLFTSGSTGEPRGVPVPHRTLAASTAARSQFYPEPVERFLVVSSLAFDSSVAGIHGTLVDGGEIVFPAPGRATDPGFLAHALADVTHTLMVPTLYAAVLSAMTGEVTSPPRRVIVAGEACPPSLVETHSARLPATTLTNEYGPTEATVWATATDLVAGEDVTIGGPIPGTWISVVDDHDLPVAMGAVGQLVVGGAGVVDGYLDAPDQTAARFADSADGRVFRTGDLVRVSPDGRLQFLGRQDDQLSVGGVRIEPAELEAVIERVDGVDAAIVCLADPRPLESLLADAEPEWRRRSLHLAATAEDPAMALRSSLRDQDRSGLLLVAHIEADDDAVLGDVEAAIADGLAPGSRPRRVLRHDALPRSANGKVDRAAVAALPVTPKATDLGDSVDPAVAASVCALMGAALGVELGLDDDAFEHGAHSLMAVGLMADLDAEFGVDLPGNALYDAPTPRRLAALVVAELRRDSEAPYRYVVPIQTSGDRPPIYAVHVLGTNAMFYRPLSARLGATQPMFGLSVPYKGPGAGTRSLAQLVSDYAEEVTRRHPEGPLVLTAVSAGSIVAMELARHLLAGGRVVRLVLFDASGPDSAAITPDRSTRWSVHTQRLRHDGLDYLTPRLVWQTQKLKRRWEQLQLRLRSGDADELPDVLVNRQYVENNLQFLAQFDASPYPDDVLILKAADDAFAEISVAAGLGWRGFVDGDLRIEIVPGGHLSMLTEPHVAVVAEQVRETVDTLTPGG